MGGRPQTDESGHFVWTAKRERAAILVAEDDLSDAEIAREVGIVRSTLNKWREHPDFNAHVGGIVGQLQAAMMRLPIAKKRKRMEAYNTRWQACAQIIAYRAERYRAAIGEPDAEAAAVAAAKRIFGYDVPCEAITGYLVEKETVNNAGMRAVEWSVDIALMKEMRALEQQAAQELGQWVERSEVGGLTTTIEIVGVDAGLI